MAEKETEEKKEGDAEKAAETEETPAGERRSAPCVCVCVYM